MNTWKLLAVLALAGLSMAGLVVWDAMKPKSATSAAIDGQGAASPSTFAEIPLPDGVPAKGVVIFTPQNCPSEAAQRARRLMGRLSDHGVPYRQTDSAEFSSLTSQEQADRVTAVMNGDIPIVYVNGRAKANPTPEEVIAEYRRGG
ncbi:MAG TPA: hypothetical protein VJ806_12085 [Luteimonas sp.]|nr:hypothetical protein [Luteimonas sp.]